MRLWGVGLQEEMARPGEKSVQGSSEESKASSGVELGWWGEGRGGKEGGNGQEEGGGR